MPYKRPEYGYRGTLRLPFENGPRAILGRSKAVPKLQARCRKRRYTRASVEVALFVMALKNVSKTHILNKKICEQCRAWHIVRDRVRSDR
jgi:hypothetical protein